MATAVETITCRERNNSLVCCSQSQLQLQQQQQHENSSRLISNSNNTTTTTNNYCIKKGSSYVGMFFTTTTSSLRRKNRQQQQKRRSSSEQQQQQPDDPETGEINNMNANGQSPGSETTKRASCSTVIGIPVEDTTMTTTNAIEPSYSYRPPGTGLSKPWRTAPINKVAPQQQPFYMGMPPRRSVVSVSKSSSADSSLVVTPPTPQQYPRRNFKPSITNYKPAVSINNRQSLPPTKLPPVVGSAGAAVMTSSYHDCYSPPSVKSYEDGTVMPSKLNGFGGSRISVALRIRPMETREISCLQIIPPKVNTVIINNGSTLRTFDFDKIFSPDETQDDIFEETRMKQFVENGINGYSCSVFCYGQTGAGKTHTLIGPPLPEEAMENMGSAWYTKVDRNQFGLIPRCMSHLFQTLQKQRASSYRVTFSAIQIYNEQLVDMFETQRPLDIRWNRETGFYIDGVSRFNVTNTREAITLLYQAAQQRFCRSTVHNPVSSRSHAVFSVGVESTTEQPNGNNNGNGDDVDNNVVILRRGKLTFVDLAGSEKNSEIEDQQREATSINKGLLVLGKCIQALSKDELGHVPYRDSKLTKVLADSLGGQSFTVMIACISPSKSNITETLTTLRYAGRARLIRTDPALRMNPLEQMMSGLHHELKLLRTENEQLRQHLSVVKRNKPGVDFQSQPNLSGNNNQPAQPAVGNGKNQADRTDTDFYDMLQEFMVENENLRQENTELQRAREKILEDCERFGRENENLKKQITEITKMLRNDNGAGKKSNKTQNADNNAVNNNELVKNDRPPVPPAATANNQLPPLSNNVDSNNGNNVASNHVPSRRNNANTHRKQPPPQQQQKNSNSTAPPSSDDIDSVGPLMPAAPAKVSNYPYSVPSSLSSASFHPNKQYPPNNIDDNNMRTLQQQQLYQQFQPPYQQYQQQPPRFIEPQPTEPPSYTSREPNRKLRFRRSPVIKVALPAVLRPPVFLYGQDPPPSTTELTLRENDRLSQELKDLDRLIRHHYH